MGFLRKNVKHILGTFPETYCCLISAAMDFTRKIMVAKIGQWASLDARIAGNECVEFEVVLRDEEFDVALKSMAMGDDFRKSIYPAVKQALGDQQYEDVLVDDDIKPAIDNSEIIRVEAKE